MRLIHTAPLAALVLLAACGGDADTGAEEAAAGAAATIEPQPGQYRVTSQLLEFSAPGASDAITQQMQAQMGGEAEVAAPITYCLTPEQAAGGPQEMAKRMAEGNCTVSRFDVAGSSVSSEMQCTGADGITTRVTMDGQMTATSSTMDVIQEIDLAGQKRQIKARTTAERIGDCPA